VRIDPPGVVFGLPAFNGEKHLPEALESLLAQTRTDLAVIVVDDCSVDRTREVSLEYAALDSRVTYERNETALGLVRNWRRAFDLARVRFPQAPYFAWASDHDIWHPVWFEVLAGELEASPESVLAYPATVRIDDSGAEFPTRQRGFDTARIADPIERLRRAGREMSAGEMIYGLFRSEALERSGPFPLVVLPDRLQLLRLSLEGEFRHVPRRLWYRRYRRGVAMSNRRQRQSSFPGGVPLRAYVPWWLSHAGLVARSSESAFLGWIVLVDSVQQAYRRMRVRAQRDRRWRRRERRRRYRAMTADALGRVRGHAPASDGPRPSKSASMSEDGSSLSLDLAMLERAEAVDGLRRPGAVVLELDPGADRIAEQVRSRYPEAVVFTCRDPDRFPEGAEICISIGFLEQLTEPELVRVVRRLHELTVPTVYSFDCDSESLWATLSRWYWLRELWLDDERRGRRPDPATRPIGREPGRRRHVVGRRRLVAGREPAGLG
jgi:glycosyltransferase involved in cell wall biosynthesis